MTKGREVATFESHAVTLPPQEKSYDLSRYRIKKIDSIHHPFMRKTWNGRLPDYLPNLV